MSRPIQDLKHVPTQTIFADHPRANVLGVKISAIDMEKALSIAGSWIDGGQAGYVCVTGVHGVMEAQRDSSLLETLNNGVMNLPDGMPMSWIGWLQGFATMDRVFGPDFMKLLCALSIARGYRHLLYGGEPGVADRLKMVLESMFPGIEIVGTFTPPFGPLTSEEERRLLALTEATRPDILWVGLGTPKQEKFMAQHVGCLGVPLLVGVGAAFDYHTGRVRDAPVRVKRMGLQWLHRLLQDPGRLSRRYLRNNPAFVWKITLQLLRFRSLSALPDTDAHKRPS